MSYVPPYRRGGYSGMRATHGRPDQRYFGTRGGGRGRGRGGGMGGRSVDSEDTNIFDGLDEQPIKLWSIESIADRIRQCDDGPVEVVNDNVIATYNWDNSSDTPSIVVPGAPKEFYEWQGGDLSRYFGQYVAANKDETMDAMFMAVRIMDPNFRLVDYDMACDLEALNGLFDLCLDVAISIRKQSNEPRLVPWTGPWRSDGKVRIEIEVVGSTILMNRKKEAIPEAGGVGPKFREVCAKQPPAAVMIKGEPVDGIYRMAKEVRMGDLRILLVHELETARFPDDTPQAGPYEAPKNVKSMKVAIGGFKGDPNVLIPRSLATRKANMSATLHPAKWINQYLCGIPYRYIGRHCKGVFGEAPALNSLDEIKQLCGLDDSATKSWIKVLKCVLTEIVTFAQDYRSTVTDHHTSARFAIISDPGQKRLQIHSYESGEDVKKAVSEETMRWLLSTL